MPGELEKKINSIDKKRMYSIQEVQYILDYKHTASIHDLMKREKLQAEVV